MSSIDPKPTSPLSGERAQKLDSLQLQSNEKEDATETDRLLVPEDLQDVQESTNTSYFSLSSLRDTFCFLFGKVGSIGTYLLSCFPTLRSNTQNTPDLFKEHQGSEKMSESIDRTLQNDVATDHHDDDETLSIGSSIGENGSDALFTNQPLSQISNSSQLHNSISDLFKEHQGLEKMSESSDPTLQNHVETGHHEDKTLIIGRSIGENASDALFTNQPVVSSPIDPIKIDKEPDTSLDPIFEAISSELENMCDWDGKYDNGNKSHIVYKKGGKKAASPFDIIGGGETTYTHAFDYHIPFARSEDNHTTLPSDKQNFPIITEGLQSYKQELSNILQKENLELKGMYSCHPIGQPYKRGDCVLNFICVPKQKEASEKKASLDRIFGNLTADLDTILKISDPKDSLFYNHEGEKILEIPKGLEYYNKARKVLQWIPPKLKDLSKIKEFVSSECEKEKGTIQAVKAGLISTGPRYLLFYIVKP